MGLRKLRKLKKLNWCEIMRKDKTQSKRTAFFAEMKRIKSVLKKENVPSSAKIIAVMSSEAPDETFSKGSISQNAENSNT